MKAKRNFSFKIKNFIFVFLLICLYFEILKTSVNQKWKFIYVIHDRNISKCPDHSELLKKTRGSKVTASPSNKLILYSSSSGSPCSMMSTNKFKFYKCFIQRSGARVYYPGTASQIWCSRLLSVSVVNIFIIVICIISLLWNLYNFDNFENYMDM